MKTLLILGILKHSLMQILIEIYLRYFYFSHPKSLTEGPIMLNMLFDILPTTFHDEIFRKCAEDEFWTEPEVASYCYQIANGLQVYNKKLFSNIQIRTV